MFRNDVFAIGFVTTYFFISVTLLQFDAFRPYGLIMSLFSPFFLCWMVYSILKYGKYSGPDLGQNEYGYQDDPKLKWTGFSFGQKTPCGHVGDIGLRGKTDGQGQSS